ncbi:MAG: DUF177 domain-containing protein [Acidimicrobiia bacterium]|nr:DUF177 domain-containing protein [Acidimicrobiia bacterium]
MVRSDFAVLVSDLIGFPGTRREITLAGPLDIDLPHARTTEAPALVNARIDATTDGVVVRGDVTADVILICTRCLAETTRTERATFDQVYGLLESEDVEPITGEGEIDIRPVARDELSLSLPIMHTCRDDCLGLCPTCGTDLNSEPCSGHPDASDSPFAALKDLLDL